MTSISFSLVFTEWTGFSPKSWSCGWFLITFLLLHPESSTASCLAGLYLSPAAKFSKFSFHPPGSSLSRWQSVGSCWCLAKRWYSLLPVTCFPRGFLHCLLWPAMLHFGPGLGWPIWVPQCCLSVDCLLQCLFKKMLFALSWVTHSNCLTGPFIQLMTHWLRFEGDFVGMLILKNQEQYQTS